MIELHPSPRDAVSGFSAWQTGQMICLSVIQSRLITFLCYYNTKVITSEFLITVKTFRIEITRIYGSILK